MIKSVKSFVYLLKLMDIIIVVTSKNEERIIGYTDIYLNGNISVCGQRECNLGNFITDAFVYSRVDNFKEFPQINFEEIKKWIMEELNKTDIDHFPQERNAIGLLYAKSIAYSIGNESDINQKFPITESDIKNLFTDKTMPTDMVIMSGKRLRLFLESNIKDFEYEKNKPLDNFLQVSGIKVIYDIKNHIKVRKVLIKCQKCDKNIYTEMNDNEFFDVMMPSHHYSHSYYSDDIIFDSKRQSFVLTMGFSLNNSDLVEKYINRSTHSTSAQVEGRISCEFPKLRFKDLINLFYLSVNGSSILEISNYLILLSLFIYKINLIII